jgi:tetratricopeptide (TPR) repeat protein
MSRRPPEYDVCLDAHPASANAARVIARFFRSAGLRVYYDDAGEGSPRLWAMHHALAASRGHLVLMGEGTPPEWVVAELEWALKRRAMYDDLFVLPLVRAGFEPGCAAGLLGVLETFELPEDKAELNNRLRDLAQKLREPVPPTKLPIFENEPESARPFTGLQPFGQKNARFFFGRDQEVIEVGQRLGKVHTGHRRWVHVSGPSGVGKSSLVRAGLVPAVRRGVIARAPVDWVVAALRPGRRPVHRLAETLTRGLGGDLWVGEALEQLRAENGLAELVQESMPADKGLLLVIDGLEDLLNVHDEEIGELDRLLAGAIDDFDERMYLVTTARDDLGQRVMARLPRTAHLAATRATYLELGAPTREGLWESIVGPVRLAGGRFAEGLAERILDDVERTPDSLPRMGYLLSMLWDRSWEGDLTHATYDALGGVTGALARDAAALLESLGPDELRRAQSMMLGLVAVGRGRGDAVRILGRAECVAAGGGGPKAEAVLTALTNIEKGAFVQLTRDELDDEAPAPDDEDAGTVTVRLAHDTLLRDWPTLRTWIEDARGALERRDEAEDAARAYLDAGAPPERQPQGDTLRHLEGGDLPPAMREMFPTLLSVDARRFIDGARGGERRREEQQDANRQAAAAAEAAHRAGEKARTAAAMKQLKVVIGGLGVVSALCLVFMFNAMGERDDLLVQRDTVEAERRRMNDLRAQVEKEKLEVEKQRLESELRFRDSERGRRAAGRESARAGQTADELLRISLEIGAVADDTIKRIPGEPAKYARRVIGQAVAKRMQEALDAAPDNDFLRFAMARQHQIQGDLWADQKQPRTALSAYEQAVIHLDKLLAAAEPLPKYFECKAAVQTGIGELYRREPLTDSVQAAAAYTAALGAHAKLAELEPDVVEHVSAQAELRRRLARIATESKDAEAARKHLDAALTLWKAVLAGPSPTPVAGLGCAEALIELAELDLGAGAAEPARARLEEARNVAAKVVPPADLQADHARLQKRIATRLKGL